ncbi:MAG TPA: hypothetical protein VFX03_03200, partial [Thermomicrobiales bacterium]|nr:hypothetical protein [Thermomicrobiales bacterium]
IACGPAEDGCGGALQCGTCDASQCLTCSGGTCVSTCTGGQTCSNGDCGCQPLTCDQVGGCSLDLVPDGCGGMLDCSCGSGTTCVHGHCCPDDLVCGGDQSGLACCSQSVAQQCCYASSQGTPSGIVAYCCGDDETCFHAADQLIGTCMAVS